MRRAPSIRAADRRARAWALALDGFTQAEIARELHVTQQAVSKMLAVEERHVSARCAGEIERYKGRQHERLEHVYRAAMRAWHRSAGEQIRKRLRTKGRAADSPQEAEVTTTEQAGDPRHLQAALQALSDQRKLWGLDAPAKVNVRTDRPLEGHSDEELRAELLDLAKQVGLVH